MTIKEYIKKNNITTENITICNRQGDIITNTTGDTEIIKEYNDNEIITAKAIACHHQIFVGTDYTYGGGFKPIDTYWRYVIKIKIKKGA